MLFPGAFFNKSLGSITALSMFLINMAISPILYGLVHFLAWGDRFPTPLERVLWRVSSFVVTCSGLVNVSVILFLTWLENRAIVSDSKSGGLTISICFVIVPFTHILASGFLVVESFRQLPFLDSAAYGLPSWSNYWPHLS